MPKSNTASPNGPWERLEAFMRDAPFDDLFTTNESSSFRHPWLKKREFIFLMAGAMAVPLSADMRRTIPIGCPSWPQNWLASST
jgi:hypothetical protein